MSENPLAPPRNPRLLLEFEGHFGLPREGTADQRLQRVARAFGRLPYENLTKIIKLAEAGTPERARRAPGEVLADHFRFGAGGTCFSLTAALLHLVRALGYQAWPLLADRRYGPDTHCAVMLELGGRPHLLDPGYLLDRPVALPQRESLEVATPFNRLLLSPRPGCELLDLFVVGNGRRSYRLTFKLQRPDDGQFLRAWDSSFFWEMMRYPVATRVEGERQLYLQGNRWQERSHQRAERLQIDPQQVLDRLSAEFGIAPHLAARALDILRRAGEPHGPP